MNEGHFAGGSRAPLSALFGSPRRQSPRLSPDGTRLAWLGAAKGRTNVLTSDSLGRKPPELVTDEPEGVSSFLWSPDGSSVLYVADEARTGRRELRAASVNPDVGTRTLASATSGVVIIATERRHPDQILVGLPSAEKRGANDLYRVNLADGSCDLVMLNPGFAVWLVDHDLCPRGGIRVRRDGSKELTLLETDGSWQTLLAFEGLDTMTSTFLTFSGDGSAVYLRSSIDSDTGRLVRFDLATRTQVVIYEHDRCDVAGVLFDQETWEPQLVQVRTDRTETVVLDPALTEIVDLMNAQGPGDISVQGRDVSGQRWLFAMSGVSEPTRYFFLDRQTNETVFLFHDRPELKNYDLAATESFTFTARDGTDIPGYLTFPNSAGQELPTVLAIHSGPARRHNGGVDPEAQWLASCGYLCVQVNFRGSTGYGKRFMSAGNGEWGRAMQDDLADAISWCVRMGLTDPLRVAMYGGSYGGYAALMGAVSSSTAVKCAVAASAPTDLVKYVTEVPPQWEALKGILHLQVGSPEDVESLRLRSPVHLVDSSCAPILLAHGARDPRVPVATADAFVDRLRQLEIPHSYLRFEDEGHELSTQANRTEFFEKAEAFLAMYLKP